MARSTIMSEQHQSPVTRSPRLSFRRIFCPTDLTQESNKALIYAAALARAFDARLCVYHYSEYPPAWDGCDKEALALSLTDASVFAHLKDIKWEGEIEKGDSPELILQAVERWDADLIVMHSRRRPLRAAILGSIAEKIVSTAPCPVLILHTDERECVNTITGEVVLKRVLVAHDFSAQGNLALAYGLSLGQEFQAHIELFYTLPPIPNSSVLFPRTEELLEAQAKLAELVPSEARNWCSINCKAIESVPYYGILEYASLHNADLICMGAHGEGHTSWMPLGSTVDWVVRRAPCPVLIARPGNKLLV